MTPQTLESSVERCSITRGLTGARDAMWAIHNRTPYAAAHNWVQDKDANQIRLVVVKAVFDILPDQSTRLAEEQEPVFDQPQHLGAPQDSALRCDTDLLGVKPCTDVIVSGSAYSPNGVPVESLDVFLSAGTIKKRLRVFGDRFWQPSLIGQPEISKPQAFTTMPLRYERSYGGWDRVPEDEQAHRLDARNPIGVGYATRAEHLMGQPLPNLEDPANLISAWDQQPVPAGLGAIERHWSPRRELAGTYDERWRETRFPLWAEDFDATYHSCAPPDQRITPHLRGGETIELVNLSPGGALRFTLPRLYPFFRTLFGRDRVEHRASLSTVLIEPDYPRVSMSWQTHLNCNGRVDDLDVTIVEEKRVI